MRLLLPILFLAACGTAPVAVDFRHDPQIDFTGLETYKWLPRKDSGDPRIDDDALEKRVVGSVDAWMGAHGYRKVEENPDFLISYHAVITKNTSTSYMGTEVYGDDWYGGRTGRPPNEVYVETFEVGTLVVDLIHPESRVIGWRGWAQASLDENPSEAQKDKLVRNAVNRLLQYFPPPPAKR